MKGWGFLEDSKCSQVWFGWFYSIKTPAGHTMPNFVYTHIKAKIYKWILSRWYYKWAKAHLPAHKLMASSITAIHHHHHHIALVARISLTLSRHSSQSFIALGRSSGQHPVSSHSCWMYVRAGRPAFARPSPHTLLYNINNSTQHQ